MRYFSYGGEKVGRKVGRDSWSSVVEGGDDPAPEGSMREGREPETWVLVVYPKVLYVVLD